MSNAFETTGYPEAQIPPSTEIVRFIDWYAQCKRLDPEHIAMSRDVLARTQRISSGVSTVEEEFGPAEDIEELHRRFEAKEMERTGSMPPRRYRLPKHLHWMGDGIHDNYKRPSPVNQPDVTDTEL